MTGSIGQTTRVTKKDRSDTASSSKSSSTAAAGGEVHLGMKSDYWYIDGVAYDFSRFIANHPGGSWAINLGRGRECAGLLHSYHLNMPTEQLLAKYRLDEEADRAAFPPTQKYSYEDDGFYKTCQRDAVAYFKANSLSHKAPWTHILFFLVNVAMIIFGMATMIGSQSYLAAVFLGVWRSLLVVQSTHAASHFSMFNNATLNRWAYRIGTVLIGLWCPTIWDLQHVVAHHIYTNEWPYDTDSAFPLKSLFANQRRFAYHKFQHIYMWLVYALTIPLVMANSIKDIIIGKQVLFKIRYRQASDKPEAILTSVAGVLFLALPFLFLPFADAFKLSLLSSVTSSLFFSLQFVVNHEIDGVVETSPAEQYTKENPKPTSASLLPPAVLDTPYDWGAYQMANSLTFAPQSKLALWSSGGLNTQVEHHLFPGVHFSHYQEMVHIVRKNAKKFGLVYHETPSLWEAIRLHYRLLRSPAASIRSSSDKKKN